MHRPGLARAVRRALPVAEPVAVGLAALGAFAWALVGQPGVTDNDAFFHMLMARRIAAGDLWPSIDMLPLTVLGDAGPDHHWLWHVLLAPFALADPGVAGLQWAQAVTAALVPVALVVVLRRWGAPWPALWAALAVAGALVMPFRVSELRAQNVAIVLIVLALYWLVRERHRPLLVLGLLFAEAYHGVVILLPLVLIHVAAVRALEGRWALRPAAYALGGAVLGFALSPWFPENVDYLLFHTLYKVGNPAGLDVGREWLSPPLGFVLRESWSVLAALAVAVGLWVWRRGWRLPERTSAVVLLAATVLMGLMYLRAWRFVEYFVPVAAVTAAVLVRDASAGQGGARPLRVARALLPAALVAAIAVHGAAGLRFVHAHPDYDVGRFRPIGDALGRLAAKGDVVLNTAWSDFPLLLWVAPHVRFVTGLDPTYLHFEDPARSALLQGLRAAQAGDEHDPAPVIAEHFGAQWAVVDRSAQGLAERLLRSPGARAVAASPAGILFRIELGSGGP